jgi:regulator of sigma D
MYINIDYVDNTDTIEIRHEDYMDYADALSVTYEVLA